MVTITKEQFEKIKRDLEFELLMITPNKKYSANYVGITGIRVFLKNNAVASVKLIYDGEEEKHIDIDSDHISFVVDRDDLLAPCGWKGSRFDYVSDKFLADDRFALYLRGKGIAVADE